EGWEWGRRGGVGRAAQGARVTQRPVRPETPDGVRSVGQHRRWSANADRLGLQSDHRARGSLLYSSAVDLWLASHCRGEVRIARQIRSGAAGSSMCSTPNSHSASTIAFATAASPGVKPSAPDAYLDAF